MNKPRSAYLHIPFCHRRCFYCDFAVVPLGDKANGEAGPGSSSIKSYLNLLHREINLVKDLSDKFISDLDEQSLKILCDAQTNGGFLISIPKNQNINQKIKK